jgi:hypothetical protein
MNGGIRERVEELAARDRRNPEIESSVFADAQTGFYGNGCSRETRAKAERNYEGVEIHDCVEKNLKQTG